MFIMKFTIIVSKKDLAGMNIYEELIKKNISDKSNVNLVVIEDETVNLKEEYFDSDYVIFATRHQSKSGEKTLSIHFPGNFERAEYGGIDNVLCMSAPRLAKQAFILLNKNAKDSNYLVSLAATHHGPNLKTPCFYIEIGSNKEQWLDKLAANIIANTIIQTIDSFETKDQEIVIGFGGMHYCSNFNKIELNSNITMSHICPKYAVEKLTKDTVLEMISSTKGIVNFALLDWKGLTGEQKNKLKSIFEDINLPYKKTKDIKTINE